MSQSNVVPLRTGHWPTAQRVVEAVSLEHFCLALEAGEWDSKQEINGMTILQYPRVVMICCDNAHCTIIRQTGTDMEAYFKEACDALDNVA